MKAREELFSILISQIGEIPEPDAVNQAIGALVEGAIKSSCAYPNTRLLLDTLKDRIRLAIVSNGLAAYTWDNLEHNQLLDFFSVRIISEEVGFEKPDPKIFQMALERLQVDSSKMAAIAEFLASERKLS